MVCLVVKRTSVVFVGFEKLTLNLNWDYLRVILNSNIKSVSLKSKYYNKPENNAFLFLIFFKSKLICLIVFLILESLILAFEWFLRLVAWTNISTFMGISTWISYCSSRTSKRTSITVYIGLLKFIFLLIWYRTFNFIY